MTITETFAPNKNMAILAHLSAEHCDAVINISTPFDVMNFYDYFISCETRHKIICDSLYAERSRIKILVEFEANTYDADKVMLVENAFIEGYKVDVEITGVSHTFEALARIINDCKCANRIRIDAVMASKGRAR